MSNKTFNINDVFVIINCSSETIQEIKLAVESVLQNGISNQNILLVNDNPNRPLTTKILKVNEDFSICNLKSNMGIVFARNIGIDYAKKQNKKLVAFLDADDIWHKDKITKQLSRINEGKSLVSSSMFERSFLYQATRKPNIAEILVGGNPIYLSSALIKNIHGIKFKNEIIEDREFFKSYIELVGLGACEILDEPLITKYNYPSRRGSSRKQSLVQGGDPLINKIRRVVFKLRSLSALKITPLRFLLYKLTTLSIGKADIGVTKRVAISINYKSAEFRNLQKFSSECGVPFLFHHYPFMKGLTRNRPLIDAKNMYEIIAAMVYSKVSMVKYIYVGLTGANGINEFMELNVAGQRCHVVHGRNNSRKFDVHSDFALLPSHADEFKVNATRNFYAPANYKLNTCSDKSIWLHGYKKGKPYSLADLVSDWQKLQSIDSKKEDLTVYCHPTAHLLKLALKLFRYNTETLNAYKTNVLYAETIYISSPSLEILLKSQKHNNIQLKKL